MMNASAPWVSLPRRRPYEMEEMLFAPFAADILQEVGADAARDWIAMAFGLSDAALRAFDNPCLGLDPDPLNLLSLVVAMTGPDAETIAAAFTRLLDEPYRGRAWGQHVQNLYVTSCPACWRPVMASAYRWQGFPPTLVSRLIACSHCGYQGESAAEPEDQDRAAEVEPGRSLHWQMMERLAPASDPLRQRIEQVTGFYSPRNLWVLWQSLRILESLDLTVDERRALQHLLALSFWRGSHFASQPDLLWQPTLRRPRRFLEYNLWAVMHEALAHVQRRSRSLASRRLVRHFPEIESASEKLTYLAQRWPGHFRTRLQANSLVLALLLPPPTAPVYWLLRFAWSGWLFGEDAAAYMKDLLALRRGGGSFLAALVSDAVRVFYRSLKPDAALILQWRWRERADPCDSIFSALPPALVRVAVAQVAEGEWMAAARLQKTPSSHPPATPNWLAVGRAAMVNVLLERGEPLETARLRPYILAAWRSEGDPPPPEARARELEALFDPADPPFPLQTWSAAGEPWQAGEAPWWWLRDPPDPWLPASDRAERLMPLLLQRFAPIDADLLAWKLTRALPPCCAPDRPWLDALIASYAEGEERRLHLREQDHPDNREKELPKLTRALVEAGRAMGFEAIEWVDDDGETRRVEWRRQTGRRASFWLTASTALTPRIWRNRLPIRGLSRFLVIPGGRAGLVQWRIDHQPLWTSAALAGGWVFVKFRHLRQMLHEPMREPDYWLARLALDPITPARAEQLSLFT
ncbi:MAG: hypothetical protein GXP42_19080 [Chloroflexi bacterium]|nr:hypothetical protein [Chloroflexota bacterium]